MWSILAHAEPQDQNDIQRKERLKNPKTKRLRRTKIYPNKIK